MLCYVMLCYVLFCFVLFCFAKLFDHFRVQRLSRQPRNGVNVEIDEGIHKSQGRGAGGA